MKAKGKEKQVRTAGNEPRRPPARLDLLDPISDDVKVRPAREKAVRRRPRVRVHHEQRHCRRARKRAGLLAPASECVSEQSSRGKAKKFSSRE